MGETNLDRPQVLALPTMGEVHVWYILGCAPPKSSGRRMENRLHPTTFTPTVGWVAGAPVEVSVGGAPGEKLSTRVVRCLIAAYEGVTPASLAIRTSGSGKPFVSLPDGLDFNLSHSGDMIACAFSAGSPVGIDVEQIRDIASGPIARRFFSPEDCRELESLSDGDSPGLFFQLWTRREALAKALGTGLDESFADIRFNRACATGDAWHVRDRTGCLWSILDLKPAAGYGGAIALRGKPERISVRYTDLGAILGEMP